MYVNRCTGANTWIHLEVCLCSVISGGNQDGKFSVGFRDGVVRTVVGLDREAQAAYSLVVEAIGVWWIRDFWKGEKTFIIFYHPQFYISVVCICCNRACFLTCFVCHLQSCSFLLVCDSDEKSCACTSAVISDYCSTAFVPVWKKKNKNSEVFLFWRPVSQGALSAMGCTETREGRRGRDNVTVQELNSTYCPNS